MAFDANYFDPNDFDCGFAPPETVILQPPIWTSLVQSDGMWTLSIHGRGQFWTPEAPAETNWS